MCKFNNRLFIFALYCLLGSVCVLAKPLQRTARFSSEFLTSILALAALPAPEDVHYDQRQKGDENYRINVDGFVLGLPQDDSSTLLLLTEDVFETLASRKNKPAAMTPLASSASSSIDKSATANTPSDSESNQNLSSNADTIAYNIPPMLVEIPTSRKYLEARQSVDAVPRTKSYISNFLNLLKKVRKH